ncbi:hypothetical protein SDC9_169369 [bioreactor metagenome]|uniref:Uncharacterized protein n=1 Tax=bioreactor metagenome TaxID=1076179 RepID=A0A645G501_9ZZZZ
MLNLLILELLNKRMIYFVKNPIPKKKTKKETNEIQSIFNKKFHVEGLSLSKYSNLNNINTLINQIIDPKDLTSNFHPSLLTILLNLESGISEGLT